METRSAIFFDRDAQDLPFNMGNHLNGNILYLS
jgi:hypothetical protein